MARTFNPAQPQGMCQGSQCPIWRWKPFLASDPAFQAAVRKAATGEFSGKPNSHSRAASDVVANRAKYDLPVEPVEGFCGLGGEVNA